MSNIPKQTNDSQRPVREFFDNYFNENLTFPGAEVDAVVGYFESRGFDRTSSISTASVILKQAKIDNVAKRRLAFSRLRNRNIVTKLFNELGPRYKERPGGYLRILKCGFRTGDKAAMAIVELVDRPQKLPDDGSTE